MKIEWWLFLWSQAKTRSEHNTKQHRQLPWGKPFYLSRLDKQECVSLLAQAYSATRHRDTTCAAMTNIRGLRLKESKATKICFCPRAKPLTALWATSDFSTSWCNATSHALALALQLEQALRILSPELIIHSHTHTLSLSLSHTHTHTHTHTQTRKKQLICCSTYEETFIGYIDLLVFWILVSYSHTNKPMLLTHTGTIIQHCSDHWNLHWSNTEWLLTPAAGTSLYTT